MRTPREFRVITHQIHPHCFGLVGDQISGHTAVCERAWQILKYELGRLTKDPLCMWCGSSLATGHMTSEVIRRTMKAHMESCPKHPYFELMVINKKILDNSKRGHRAGSRGRERKQHS